MVDPLDDFAPPGPTRCGFVAVLGAPNAGKSTLVNALVGEKVTIVSDKVQTTRMPVRGIRIHEADDARAQIVFVDTPGIFTPGKRFERAMVASAWGAGDEADLVMLVIDAGRKGIPDRETSMIIDRIRQGRAPAILVFNKVDAIRPESLLPLTARVNALHDFKATFMISALKERGTRDLLPWLAAHLPPGPFLYPEDEITDLPLRLMAAELTREKLFQRLYRELPHALTVETETWEAFDDGSVRIAQVIFVEREGQRKIILGTRGEMIREVGQEARRELAAIVGRTVHLKLFVKVREDWAEDAERYAPWSLEFNA